VDNARPNAAQPSPRSAPEPGDVAEVRLLLICQSEGLRNRYSDLAGLEETDDNSGLTAVGWDQTNLLAGWLKAHERIDALISGPQLRSRLTAQRLGQVLGLPVKVRADLPRFATDHGRSPGTNTEMPRLLSLLAHQLENAPPEGPEYAAFRAAVVEVIDQVLTEHWGKTIAVVTSGAVVAATVREFFGAQFLPIAVNHSGITEFSRRNGLWRLMYLNRREHLPLPPLAPGSQTAGAASPAVDQEELARIVEVYNRVGARSVNDQLEAERRQRMRDLLRFARLAPDLRILDAGTGGGQFALLLAEETQAREVLGIDVSPAQLEAAEYLRLSRARPYAGRISFRLAPAQALPFSDEWFDAAVCRFVLHHTHKPERILQELARVLKPGGALILADLLGADDAVRRATQNAIEARRNPAHAAARTAEQYRKLVAGAGLAVEADKAVAFDRELDEWLDDLQTEPGNRALVREMIEAGLETDASGLHARRQAGRIVFDQRVYYLRAVKKA
jgi:ubiquinone/menaquinone biosynthesis C-methylase UbiE/broad specificity phosphatase PhoE